MKTILLTLAFVMVGCIRHNVSEPIPTSIDAPVPKEASSSVNCQDYIIHLCASQRELVRYECNPIKVNRHIHYSIIECDGDGGAFNYDVEQIAK